MKKTILYTLTIIAFSIGAAGLIFTQANYFNNKHDNNKIDKLKGFSFINRNTKKDVYDLLGKPDRIDKESIKYWFITHKEYMTNDDGSRSLTAVDSEAVASKEVLVYFISNKVAKVVIGTTDEVLKVDIE